MGPRKCSARGPDEAEPEFFLCLVLLLLLLQLLCSQKGLQGVVSAAENDAVTRQYRPAGNMGQVCSALRESHPGVYDRGLGTAAQQCHRAPFRLCYSKHAKRLDVGVACWT
jgi:hypothetical protein